MVCCTYYILQKIKNHQNIWLKTHITIFTWFISDTSHWMTISKIQTPYVRPTLGRIYYFLSFLSFENIEDWRYILIGTELKIVGMFFFWSSSNSLSCRVILLPSFQYKRTRLWVRVHGNKEPSVVSWWRQPRWQPLRHIHLQPSLWPCTGVHSGHLL